MRVVRGRASGLDSDRQRTADLVAWTATTGEPALRVWQPPPHVAFGPRDTHARGYADAKDRARTRGYETVVRATGGRAVLATDDTVSFLLTRPVDDIRQGITDRYEDTLDTLQRSLWRLNVPAQRGEPAHSFCPGNHSLQYRGKLGGLAQRLTGRVAIVSGIVIVSDHETVATDLLPVYRALGIPFEPESVSSIERAGGPADADLVMSTIEKLFTSSRNITRETIDGNEIDQ